jgi:DNA topoisomerase-3
MQQLSPSKLSEFSDVIFYVFKPIIPYFSTQGVAMCLNACSNETGVLVLDPQSAPKWRLSCNRCPSVVSLFEGASKLRVLDKRCECGALKMSVEYKVD